MRQVILGMGSNKSYNGKKSVELLRSACEKLSEILDSPVFSSVYISKPMYVTCQDDFYNMAASGFVSDDETPEVFLDKIHKIENEFGRNRSKEIRNGPRPLDIDIEFFGEISVNSEILQIPHPRIKERAFVLIPVLEILKKSADEQLWKKLNSYLENLPDQGVHKL